LNEIALLMDALKSYLKSNGLKVLSLAKATSQKYVNIALRGLFWYYTPTIDYPKLMNIVEKLVSDEKAKLKLEKLGIIIVKLDEEYYLKMEVLTLERLVKEALKS